MFLIPTCVERTNFLKIQAYFAMQNLSLGVSLPGKHKLLFFPSSVYPEKLLQDKQVGKKQWMQLSGSVGALRWGVPLLPQEVLGIRADTRKWMETKCFKGSSDSNNPVLFRVIDILFQDFPEEHQCQEENKANLKKSPVRGQSYCIAAAATSVRGEFCWK